jgi:hypothetical protein
MNWKDLIMKCAICKEEIFYWDEKNAVNVDGARVHAECLKALQKYASSHPEEMSKEYVVCPRCNGTGMGTSIAGGFQCNQCKGRGRVERPDIPHSAVVLTVLLLLGAMATVFVAGVSGHGLFVILGFVIAAIAVAVLPVTKLIQSIRFYS